MCVRVPAVLRVNRLTLHHREISNSDNRDVLLQPIVASEETYDEYLISQSDIIRLHVLNRKNAVVQFRTTTQNDLLELLIGAEVDRRYRYVRRARVRVEEPLSATPTISRTPPLLRFERTYISQPFCWNATTLCSAVTTYRKRISPSCNATTNAVARGTKPTGVVVVVP